MKMKWIKITAVLLVLAIACGAAAISLAWNGYIILNGLPARKYPVKGVDVSAYQGEIDWRQLANEKIAFAFIKATEGSSFVDKRFADNFAEAQKTDLAVGAYHFFSYDSEGKTQAENFINTVQPYEGMLPPVIDIEFYGDKELNLPTREYVDVQLKDMLQALEKHYGQKPILYATEKSYALYLAGDYEEYDIWIRNVITKPKISDQRNWTFWQYTNREKLSGYQGTEEYIDMNVFYGSKQDFDVYVADRGYDVQRKG